ncbi:hypothetical protein ACFQ0M_48325 [Kitasatospora aburaviensis]|uniref:DUF4253 domain-containing protein n=1 Tax=Kitasatospora aburaviensis TaxID=67265 RepID=A0ABW1EY85_9ACTN
MGPEQGEEPDAGGLLEQEVWWVDRMGIRHRIADMEPRYCRNVIAFLQRQADDIADTYAYNLTAVGLPPEDTQAWDDVNDAISDELCASAADPVAWLNAKPLLVALRRQAAVEETWW